MPFRMLAWQVLGNKQTSSGNIRRINIYKFLKISIVLFLTMNLHDGQRAW